jgi:peptidylprolyl isomerase
MAFPKGLKSLALAAMLAVGASATPALAQGGKVDEAHQAQVQQAAEDAAKVLNQAEKTKIPDAVVPQDPQNIWDLDLSTGGRVRIQLRPDVAPNHVARIKELTRQGFYNGLKFHRVIDGFMAQGGDPKGDGTGGSTLPDLKQEFNMLPHLRGTVSMARAASEDSANSQFFIIFLPRMQLDKKYTVFGRVIEGMQYVDAIARGEPPVNPAIIVQASIEADGKAPPAMLAPPPPVPQTLPSTPLPATPATLPPRKR